jgi:hypothetical protein
MKTECTRHFSSFQALGRREIITDFNGGTITSDGGVLFLREVEQRTTILQRFSQCFAPENLSEKTRNLESVLKLGT